MAPPSARRTLRPCVKQARRGSRSEEASDDPERLPPPVALDAHGPAVPAWSGPWSAVPVATARVSTGWVVWIRPARKF